MITELHDPKHVAEHSKWDNFLIYFKHDSGEVYLWERNGYAATNPDFDIKLRAIGRAELPIQYGNAYGHARDMNYSGEIYIGAWGEPIKD